MWSGINLRPLFWNVTTIWFFTSPHASEINPFKPLRFTPFDWVNSTRAFNIAQQEEDLKTPLIPLAWDIIKVNYVQIILDQSVLSGYNWKSKAGKAELWILKK